MSLSGLVAPNLIKAGMTVTSGKAVGSDVGAAVVGTGVGAGDGHSGMHTHETHSQLTHDDKSWHDKAHSFATHPMNVTLADFSAYTCAEVECE